MDSAAFRMENKKEDPGLVEIEFIKLKRQQKYLIGALATVLLLVLFCTVMVIWLAVEVVEDNDDDNARNEISGNTNAVTLTRAADSSSDAQPLLVGTGYWTEKASLPYGRSDHYAVAVDDFVYIIGGQNGTNDVEDTVMIYDTVLDTYTTGPTLPSPRFRFGAAYDTERRQIYIFGGLDDADGDALDRVDILDIESLEWTEGPQMPLPRSDLCGAYVDGHIYAIGGYSVGYDETLDRVEALDVMTNEWTEVEKLPTPRGDCKAANLDGKVIVVGGYYDETGEWDSNAFRDEVELYSPGTDTWEEKALLRNARGDKSIAVLPNERLLVIGGETHNRGVHTEVAMHHVEEYNLAEDIWIDRAPLPYAIFRTASVYVNGMVYVFGGHLTCDRPEDEDVSICVASDVVQVYFDIEQ